MIGIAFASGPMASKDEEEENGWMDGWMRDKTG